MNGFKRMVGCGLFSLTACLGMGCSTPNYAHFDLIYYPTFFSDNATYSSIAVAPVENTVERGQYTRQLNSDLVQGYVNNNSYKVYNYTNERMRDSQLIAHLREKGDVDLVLFSSVVNYGEERSDRIDTRYETETVYRLDAEGNKVYDENGRAIIERTIEHAINYKVYERTAYASMSVQLVEVASGNSVWTDTRNKSCYEEVQNPRNFSSAGEARWCAFDKVTSDIVYQTSPTSKRVNWEDKNAVGIQRYDDDGWEEETDIPINEEVRLVFWFPSEAKHNTFSFDIIAAESQKKLAGDTMYYEGKSFVYKYKMSELVNLAGGEQEFKVRLWDHKGLVVARDFEVD